MGRKEQEEAEEEDGGGGVLGALENNAHTQSMSGQSLAVYIYSKARFP